MREIAPIATNKTQLTPPPETSKQPLIGTSDAPLKGTYVWLMIDQDVYALRPSPQTCRY